MGRTPDRQVGPSLEEETQYEDRGPGGDNAGDPSVDGAIRRVTDTLRFKASGGVEQVLKAANPPAGFADVDLTGVQDGDLLEYEAATKKFVPGAGGGGLSEGSHRNLDQLVHLIAEDSFDEIIYSGNQVTDIITWTNSGKTQKIREETFTYVGNQVTKIVTKQYDGAGVLLVGETMTEDITYTGNKVDDITRALT